MSDLNKGYQSAKHSVLQSGECYLVFNKLTGALCGRIGASDNPPQSDYFNYKKVTMNPATQVWVGDYATGRLMDIDAAPALVYEAGLNKQAMQKIRNKYDYWRQINALIAIVDGLMAGTISDEALAEYSQIKDYIAKTRQVNQRYKQGYTDSPDHSYISDANNDTMFAEQLEGGLHELLGPRE